MENELSIDDVKTFDAESEQTTRMDRFYNQQKGCGSNLDVGVYMTPPLAPTKPNVDDV